MAITLTPDQERWLQAQVARGDFASVEEAARQLIDERIAEHEIENDVWLGLSRWLMKPSPLLSGGT